jgi:hypothetical protein
MAHTVTYKIELGIIETSAQGKLTLREAKELISEITECAITNNCFLCLSDYREAIMDMSTFQIYDVPKVLSNVVDSLGLHPNQFKRAIIVTKGLNDFNFFETVSRNAGQNIKLFKEIDEAKKWLLEMTPPNKACT